MPSAAEETAYLLPSGTTQDFLSRDVDVLVSQIKENLRLSSLKSKSSVARSQRINRPSPYQIPSRSWSDCEMCVGRNSTKKGREDPYELLQELLREGGLIKEAVKRLQTNIGDGEVFRRKTDFYEDEEQQLNLQL